MRLLFQQTHIVASLGASEMLFEKLQLSSGHIPPGLSSSCLLADFLLFTQAGMLISAHTIISPSLRIMWSCRLWVKMLKRQTNFLLFQSRKEQVGTRGSDRFNTCIRSPPAYIPNNPSEKFLCKAQLWGKGYSLQKATNRVLNMPYYVVWTELGIWLKQLFGSSGWWEKDCWRSLTNWLRLNIDKEGL